MRTMVGRNMEVSRLYKKWNDSESNKLRALFSRLCYLLISFDLLTVLTPLKLMLPWTTQAAITAVAILVLLTIDLDSVVRNKYVLILLLSYSLFVGFWLVQHGPSMNQYLYRFSRLVPLFFAGVLVSRNYKRIANIFFITLVAVFLGNIPFISNIDSLVMRSELAEMGEIFTSPTRYMVAVLASLTSAFVYNYFKKKLLMKILIIILSLSALITVIKSGFTVAILCLLIGLIIMGGTSLIRILKSGAVKTTLVAVSCIGLVLIVYYALIKLAPESVPTDRIRSIIVYIKGDSSINMETVSGMRTYLGQVSLNSFILKPYIGVGAHAFIFGETIIGGHSTILDMLAQFGLLGGIPIICMLLSWIIAAIKINKFDKSTFLGLVLIGWWSAYFAGCLMNPYLFSGAVDHYVFTFAGITVGLARNIEIYNIRKRVVTSIVA